MEEREEVARRVSATCIVCKKQRSASGSEMLARILGMAILEAKSFESPTTAPDG